MQQHIANVPTTASFMPCFKEVCRPDGRYDKPPPLAVDSHVWMQIRRDYQRIKTMPVDQRRQTDSPQSAHVGRQPSIDRWAIVTSVK